MVENRLDRLDERLDKISLLQAEMNGSLKEHMRRTEIAEENIEKIAEALKPVQHHVLLTTGVFRIIMVILGSAASIISLLQYLTNR